MDPDFSALVALKLQWQFTKFFLQFLAIRFVVRKRNSESPLTYFKEPQLFHFSHLNPWKIIYMGGGPEKKVYFLLISVHFQNVAQVFLFLPITWGLTTTNSLALASVITPFIMLQISITSCNSWSRSNDGILRLPARKARAEVNGSALMVGSVASTLGQPFSPVWLKPLPIFYKATIILSL